MVPWVGLCYVIVALPAHIHFFHRKNAMFILFFFSSLRNSIRPVQMLPNKHGIGNRHKYQNANKSGNFHA